jgi:hypothetical protein
MRHVNLLRTAGIILASALLVMSMQGAALARGHGGFGGGGGHGGGFAGGGFGGHAGFAARGFGGGFAGRGFAGRGFPGGRGGYGRGGYGRGGYGRGYGRYGYGRYGGFGYGGWGWGAGLGLGLWLSVLPWDYETLWWDGLPYYYADNDYYTWDPQVDEYQQVQPPPQIAQQAAEQPPAPTELFAYPKNGQSEQQQATDKVQCRAWARGQSGYNPADAASVTAPPGATPPTNTLSTADTPVNAASPASGTYSTAGATPAGTAAPTIAANDGAGADPPASALFAKRNAYLRAEVACLTGRGYSVR